MYQTGQIVISVTASARAKSLMDTGFPVEYVYPKEGSPAVMVSACPISATRRAAVGPDFVNICCRQIFSF